MKPLVKNLAAVLLLTGTVPLLVADSVEKCENPAQNVTFTVSGNCGPEGTLHVWTEKDRCEISLEGAETLGLEGPGTYGRLSSKPYDMKQGGWSLTSNITVTVNADAGAPFQETGARNCISALQDGTLKMRCEDTATYDNPKQVLASCEAVLTPQ